MVIIKAIILGVVQGISEFFPISSSGHLSLLSNIMGVQLDLTFMIMLHLGTMVAVIMYFLKETKRCCREFKGIISDLWYNFKEFSGYRGDPGGPEYRKITSGTYRKITLMILTAMVPTVILACIIYPVTNSLDGSLLMSGMGLFITGFILMIAHISERSGKGPKESKFTDALLVGVFQGMSALPGVSRLGMTLSAGFFSGFTAKFNRLFCFLLSIPTIIGAIIFEIASSNWDVASLGVFPSIVGMLSAMIAGYFTISIAIRILSKMSIKNFAVYCFIISVVSIVFYLV